jgi:hypothetical protein
LIEFDAVDAVMVPCLIDRELGWLPLWVEARDIASLNPTKASPAARDKRRGEREEGRREREKRGGGRGGRETETEEERDRERDEQKSREKTVRPLEGVERYWKAECQR